MSHAQIGFLLVYDRILTDEEVVEVYDSYKQRYESKNVDGNIALFPSWLEHYTDQAKPGQERITIGIDLIPTEFFNIGVKEDKKSHWEKL